jgi:hypothetical protein
MPTIELAKAELSLSIVTCRLHRLQTTQLLAATVPYLLKCFQLILLHIEQARLNVVSLKLVQVNFGSIFTIYGRR